MAITNAQQYKQLVNPPMKGNKRPGYRGDDAYGGGTTAGGQRSGGERGDGPASGGGALGDQGGSDYGQFVRKAKANVKIAPEIERAQTRRDLPKNILKQVALSFLPPPIRLGYTAFNFAPKPFQDKIKTAFLTGPKTTDDDDDDIPTSGGGEGQDNTGIMMAQAFTPYQQDIVKDEVEELSPIALALQQRDLMGGPRAFAKEGGIMDLETGRQMYFLGKLVKKVKRGVKKIVKSPIGKTALAAAGIFKLGGGSFTDLLKRRGSGFELSNIPFMPEEGKDRLALAAAAGLTAAPLLLQEDDTEDEYQKFLASRGASGQGLDIQGIRNDPYAYLGRAFVAEGGKPEPVAKKTLPLLDMGGQEMDLRAEGGFVPIGRMEKADDVPARLSKNEFVFTADAVRNAGEGDVDKGAEVMYNMMKNLESGGEVSEESQGLDGARRMFQTSQRLEEVL
jgi:hypothetical protein